MKNTILTSSNKSIILLVTAMAIMIPSAQMAFADPLPSVTLTPQVPVQGGIVTITATPAPLGYPTNGMPMVMYEFPEPAQVVPDNSPAACLPLLTPGNPANNVWQLEDGSGTIVRFNINSPGSATATFGSGGTPLVSVTGPGSTVTPPSPAYVWVDKNVGNLIQADNLNLLTTGAGAYQLIICGDEGAFQTRFQGSSAVETQKPVAGEILPINTTALLVAGVSSNPIMVLSALAVVAVGAFAVLRLQVIGRNF